MDNKTILSHTDKTLRRLPGTRRLGVTYALWAVGLTLLLQLVSFMAGAMTENTGGLGGIGMRSVYQTLQLVCSYASMVALPFLQYGYAAVCLRAARGHTSQKSDLLRGFRRFFPLLRQGILWILLLILLSVAASNAAAILYMLIPGTTDAIMEFQELLMNDPNLVITDEMVTTMLQKLWLMYVLFGVILIALLIPLSYRLRLTTLAILDGENRVLLAMFTGWKAMHGKCLQLFFLDLRFWGYYLLTGLSMVAAYSDRLLGFTGDVAFWCAIVASLGIQALATILYLPRLNTAQAHFYLTHYPTEQPSPKESL